MNWLKETFSGSLTWILGAVSLLVFLIFAPLSWGVPLGGGLLWKGLTALVAIVVWIAGFRLFFWVRSISLFQSDTLTSIRSNPMASAVWLGFVALALAILTGSAFGQPPTPAAWPSSETVQGGAPYAQNVRQPGRPTWPRRFAECEPYREEIERAVRLYWGSFQYPEAWAAQLYQESLCDPAAVSPVGAAGLAQFMPATWRETAARLGVDATPHDDIAIEAGAFYMMQQMGIWRAPRPHFERWQLALASYNAGAGNIIGAQTKCGGARDWSDVQPCLQGVTGHHSRETTTYVVRTKRWWREMAAGSFLSLPQELR
jgi:hypothetical protein